MFRPIFSARSRHASSCGAIVSEPEVILEPLFFHRLEAEEREAASAAGAP